MKPKHCTMIYKIHLNYLLLFSDFMTIPQFCHSSPVTLASFCPLTIFSSRISGSLHMLLLFTRMLYLQTITWLFSLHYLHISSNESLWASYPLLDLFLDSIYHSLQLSCFDCSLLHPWGKDFTLLKVSPMLTAMSSFRRCSIYNCWMGKWMNQWITNTGQ